MTCTFHVYTDRATDAVVLTDGDHKQHFATEAAAIDAAVRIAQAMKALYKINYWKA